MFSRKMGFAATCVAVALLAIGAGSAQAGQADELMDNVARNCTEMEVFTPGDVSSSDLSNFENYQRYYRRDGDRLAKIMGDLTKIETPVRGKPFNEFVALCESKIATNKGMMPPSAEEMNTAEAIIRRCEATQEITFPRPALVEDRELGTFLDLAERLEDDVATFEKQSGRKAEEATYDVLGKPFNQQLADCRGKVARVQSVMPHIFHRALLYDAESVATHCGSLLGSFSSADFSDSGARSMSNDYHAMLDDISTLEQADPEIMNWEDGALTKCREGLISRYDRYLKDKKVFEEEERIKAEERAVREEAQRQARIATLEALKDRFDVKEVYTSMAEFINAVGRGAIAVRDGDNYVIEVFGAERFKVSSLVDSYAIYSRINGSEFIQFAVEKESGVYYGQDTDLLNGYYQMAGSEKFRNVLGAVNEVLVFERIAEK